MAKIRLSDKEFWKILRENAGLFARTARAIEKEFGITYSRQAVQERARKKPDILQDIYEQNLDVAEEGLFTLMRSKNERVKQRTIEFYLKTKGKERGYIVQVNSDITSNGQTVGFGDFLMSAATIEDEEGLEGENEEPEGNR